VTIGGRVTRRWLARVRGILAEPALQLDAGGKLDMSQMRVTDHLVLAPGCGPRTKAAVHLASLVEGNAFAACKLPSHTLAEIAFWPEGGVRSLRVSVPNSATWTLDDATTACVRKVIEPVLACPSLETNISSGISYTPSGATRATRPGSRAEGDLLSQACSSGHRGAARLQCRPIASARAHGMSAARPGSFLGFRLERL